MADEPLFHIGSPNLRQGVPDYRPFIVDGLFRRGEVVNWIASPKVGKTWMLYGLLMAITAGGHWLGRRASKGRVLLIDNELHPETGLQRLHKVAQGSGADLATVDDHLSVAWLRGQGSSFEAIEHNVRQYPKGHFTVIALDAFYRMLPKGVDENANGDMVQIYNHLDRIASISGAAIINVHHASKGDQSQKGTTDVGSGAGSISRATDTHIVFLRHREEGCVTMRAVCRSSAPPDPIVLRIDPPSVTLEPNLDPADIWTPKGKPKARVWSVDEFVAMFVDGKCAKGEVVERAMSHGIPKGEARELLASAESLDLVEAETVKGVGAGRPRQVLRRVGN